MSPAVAVYGRKSRALLSAEDLNRITAALTMSAEDLEREARSRKWAGSRWKDARALIREDAAAMRHLAARLTGEAVT